MAHIQELLGQLRNIDSRLADEIQNEINALANRRAFGLNFERHTPEVVELPGRRVHIGDKVHVRPRSNEGHSPHNRTLFRVVSIDRENGRQTATLESAHATSIQDELLTATVTDLVVVAEFFDPIYPGVISTGRIEAGGDKPFHAAICAENFHALQTLLFTHRGRVDVIYIDPPYNTGAKDWKYNNDYVEADDLYRHSKWLAFMERRLFLAKELLNLGDSVLVVTIDEKEYLRLGLLLEQTFPEANITMVSSVINPAGAGREADFSRTDEYIYFVRIGAARVGTESRMLGETPVAWDTLRRSSLAGARGNRGPGACGPNQFYPIYVDSKTGTISEIGAPLPETVAVADAPAKPGLVTVLPIRPDGIEINWGVTPGVAERLLKDGFLRAGRAKPKEPQKYVISYLTAGIVSDIEAGVAVVRGKKSDGTVDAFYPSGRDKMPTTNWQRASHDAQQYGTKIVNALLGGRPFPYPKSLYAVEDTLRFFVGDKPNSIVVDFFAGSGTTAHAVMRLNKQDGGNRQSIVVTNNEVAAREQVALLAKGLRPGDSDWERWGICDYITKPRIRAAVTGETPDGFPVEGEYKFTDEFPMRNGFEENVEFFTLTYEAPMRVQSNREFQRISPFLWLRAGARGRRIESLSKGWDVADVYGVLADLDHTDEFVEAMLSRSGALLAYIVTDEDRLFEAVVQELPEHIEPIRLYESYLRNFEIDAMRSVR